MSRRSGNICKRGHDKTVEGRRKDGRCLACLKQDRSKHEAQIPDAVRKANGRRRTQDSVRRKRERLAGRPKPDACDVCGSNEQYKHIGICFDHDHNTGAFRGWLCSRCNLALGLTRDDPETLLKLALYLEKHRAK